MFKRISYTIALQFTAFVFLLLLVNGLVFLAADLSNAHRLSNFRLDRTATSIIDRMRLDDKANIAVFIPPPVRGQVRIADPQGGILYEGSLFEDIPFDPAEGYFRMRIEGEEYNLLTARIMRPSGLAGYIQVADVQRLQAGDLPLRSLLYLAVSVVISLLTFFVGLFFARRSLKPAQQMMRRLEQFTQDASHELRTPLATMSSSLDLALKTGKHQEGILSAKDDLKEVSVLVEKLLELARLDKLTLQMEKVDLSALIDQTIDKYRGIARERNVNIVGDIKPGVMVHADSALIRQITANLLANAIKFSKIEGGTVTLTLSKHTLEVKYDGIGIAPDAVMHIFNRFYQADDSRTNDGYGLGLALVKRIVDLHGWRIDVKSTKGKGTAFTVKFGK